MKIQVVGTTEFRKLYSFNLKWWALIDILTFSPTSSNEIALLQVKGAYMNLDWVTTHPGLSSFHFSIRIWRSIQIEMPTQNHVNVVEFHSEMKTKTGRTEPSNACVFLPALFQSWNLISHVNSCLQRKRV
jgi:hypothetical protein